MGWWSKTKKIIHGVDQVVSSPVIGTIISTIPVVNTAVGVIHAADKLFPNQDAAAQKRAAAIEAIQRDHPDMSATDAGKLVDALDILNKLGATSIK